MLSRLASSLFRRKRRYRDATFHHADLRKATEAPWWEKAWRWLFKAEYCDNDGHAVKRVRRLRRLLGWIFLLLLLWFVIESLLVWDVFSG